ncbi:unnamed protein product, partial [Brassica rapa subsp. trilocularis]
LKKHVRSLYLAADKYEIPHLRDLCRMHLISSLNSANALNILELAQIPFDKALNDAAFTTIKNNISTIASSAEFKLFVVNHPDLSVEIMKASLIRPLVLKKIMESDEFKASSKLETVTFSEMKHEELEALVEFMYCVDGSICLESLKKHVGSLYLAADKYEIPHLRDLCRNQLKSSLNSSNALNTFELAQIPFDKALNDAAFTTIKNNINTIANSAEFKLFVVNNPYLSVEIMK